MSIEAGSRGRAAGSGRAGTGPPRFRPSCERTAVPLLQLRQLQRHLLRQLATRSRGQRARGALVGLGGLLLLLLRWLLLLWCRLLLLRWQGCLLLLLLLHLLVPPRPQHLLQLTLQRCPGGGRHGAVESFLSRVPRARPCWQQRRWPACSTTATRRHPLLHIAAPATSSFTLLWRMLRLLPSAALGLLCDDL